MIVVTITVMKKFTNKFDDSDLRLTRQRKVILDEFKKPNSHLTADEVYERVRRKIPRVSLGTIYRNLEILSESGLLNKVELAGHQKLFDGNLKKHYHVRCANCDKVLDIPAESIKITTMPLKILNDFEIHDYRLELLGDCKKCHEQEISEDENSAF